MSHFKKTALALAVASSIALVGCNNSGAYIPGSESAGVETVAGAAVKGVLKSANVTVYELDDSGTRIRSFESVTTDANGEYEVALSDAYEGGLLEVEVAAVPGQTKMVCDAAACDTIGQDIDVPADFKLTSIAKKVAGSDKISAPVTAWTTMAANRAKAKASAAGGLDKSLAEANFKVQQLVGFDPSKVAAKDATDPAKLGSASSEEQQAAVMNAVVAELVFSGGSAESFATKLESFTKSIENDDDFGDVNDGFSVAEFAAAGEQTLSVVQVSDSTAASKLQKQQEVFSDPENAGGVSTPEYNPDLVVGDNATQAEKIESFKSFVATVRAWATSIEDLDTAQLGEVVDVETIQTVFSEGPVTSLKLAQEIVNQSLDQVTLSPAEMGELLETGNTKQIPILDNGVEVGTAVLSVTDESGVKINVVGQMTGEANTNFLPFNLTIKTNLPVSAFDLTTETIKSLLASSEVVISGAVENGSGQAIARLNDVTARLQLANALSAGTEGFVTDDQVIQAFAGASLSGNVELFAETGESFSGNVEAQVTKLAKSRFVLNDAPVSIRKLRVAGTFTAAQGETFDASATLNVNNASEFDTLAWLDYSEEERWIYEPVNGQDVLDVFGSDEADLVNPYVEMEVYQGEGYLRAGGFVGDGEEKQYSPYFGSETGVASNVNDVLVASLVEAIPQLTMMGQDDQGNPQTITVDLVDMLIVEELEANWLAPDPEFPDSGPGLSVRVGYVPTQGQNFDVYYEGQDGTGFQVFASLSQYGAFEISVSGGDVDETVVSAIESSLAISGADWRSFNTNLGETASGEFARPASTEFYNECVANAEQVLNALGQSYALEWQSAESACASATLSEDSFGEELDGPAMAAADNVVRTALAVRYGVDLANRLVLDNYYLRATENNSESFLSAGIEFPNLESETSFIDASLTLSATARNIPDMPEAKVTVTANRNSFLGGQLFATLKYDQGQYEIEVSSDNLDQPTEVNGRFYDAYGKELVLKANFNAEGDFSGLSGDAFINDEDIGDVTLRNGIPVITYPNGDETVFESLF